MAMNKFKDLEGKIRPATQAIREYFGSPGYPEVTLAELKNLMPSMGGPGTVDLGALSAAELGWTEVAMD